MSFSNGVARQSAVEWAASLHEDGAASVDIVHRHASLADPVPDLNPDIRQACRLVSLAVWVALIVDYLLRWHLSERRAHNGRTHLVDVAVIVLPMLRPLRAERALAALKVINRSAGGFARGRVLTHKSALVACAGAIAAMAVLDAERGQPEAIIGSYGTSCGGRRKLNTLRRRHIHLRPLFRHAPRVGVVACVQYPRRRATSLCAGPPGQAVCTDRD